MNSAIDIINIPEANTFIALDEKLQKFNLDCRHLFAGETPILEMVHKEKVTQVNTLEAAYEQITNNGRQGLNIQRYKGLGEMNPNQLWDTTMDPERRKMIKVTMADAVEAERIFVLLMGEQVSPRREYIERFAESVKDLDI